MYCLLHFSAKENIFGTAFFLQNGKSFKPVAALFHTGCCPLHLHGMSKMLENLQLKMTGRFKNRLNSLKDNETNRTDR